MISEVTNSERRIMQSQSKDQLVTQTFPNHNTCILALACFDFGQKGNEHFVMSVMLTGSLVCLPVDPNGSPPCQEEETERGNWSCRINICQENPKQIKHIKQMVRKIVEELKHFAKFTKSPAAVLRLGTSPLGLTDFTYSSRMVLISNWWCLTSWTAG